MEEAKGGMKFSAGEAVWYFSQKRGSEYRFTVKEDPGGTQVQCQYKTSKGSVKEKTVNRTSLSPFNAPKTETAREFVKTQQRRFPHKFEHNQVVRFHDAKSNQWRTAMVTGRVPVEQDHGSDSMTKYSLSRLVPAGEGVRTIPVPQHVTQQEIKCDWKVGETVQYTSVMKVQEVFRAKVIKNNNKGLYRVEIFNKGSLKPCAERDCSSGQLKEFHGNESESGYVRMTPKSTYQMISSTAYDQ